MTRDQLRAVAERIVGDAAAASVRIVTAESCTGGLIAAFLTDVPGSSAVLERGLVTYSNGAKTDLLGVPAETIERWGAVSEPVARAMAEGALRNAHAELSVAVTGVAGPGGGSAEKPVGTVHFACARTGSTVHRVERFGDLGRNGVRLASVAVAFQMLDAMIAVGRNGGQAGAAVP